MASLEKVLDLNTTSFEDIIGRLKFYEERIFDDEEPHEDQTKLMDANNEASTSQNNQEGRRDYSRDLRNQGPGTTS